MKIYQLTNITECQMECYIFSMPDGKTVVIDGGMFGQSEEIRRVLDKIGAKSVDAWFLTHIHNDHYGAIMDFLDAHPDFPVKRIVRQRMDASEPFFIPIQREEVGVWNEFEKRCPVPLETAVIGDRFSFGDVTMEVLWGAHPEITENLLNNQSLVFRFEDPHFSILFLGDLGEEGGDGLLASVPLEKLRCDGVQMAHHGQRGVKEDFYRAIRPRYAFWPTLYGGWWNMGRAENGKPNGIPNSGQSLCLQTRMWMEKLNTINITALFSTVEFDTETRTWKDF